jgi:hypothetical protein
MRPIVLAAVLTAAMLLPAKAIAFELDSPSPVGGIGGANFDLGIDPSLPEAGTVLERFADGDTKGKPGKLQVFGDNLPTYGMPNYIPGPPNEAPNWLYSTPAFRTAR